MVNLPKEFNRWGLKMPLKPKKRRLIATITGESGTGKSSFMLRTGPRPLLYIDLDKNLEGVIDAYEGEAVHIKQVDIPAVFESGNKSHQERDYKIVSDLQEMYMEAVESEYYAAIVIDGGEWLYALARRGILGGGMEFGEVKRTEFSAVNSYMKAFFDVARSKRVNLVYTAQLKDEYKGASSTGKRIMDGWKQAVQCSQCHVLMSKESGVIGPEKFRAEVLKCTANSDLETFELVGEEISFTNLGTMVYPQSNESEWV